METGLVVLAAVTILAIIGLFELATRLLPLWQTFRHKLNIKQWVSHHHIDSNISTIKTIQPAAIVGSMIDSKFLLSNH